MRGKCDGSQGSSTQCFQRPRQGAPRGPDFGPSGNFHPPHGVRAYAKHLKHIETHLLDTGHFALEEDHTVIAEHMRRFLREKGIR
jgi:pimeloyl-ACP methyl ester carboxylesterase